MDTRSDLTHREACPRTGPAYTLYLRVRLVMAKTRVVKWGKGLAVRIPKAVAARVGLKKAIRL